MERTNKISACLNEKIMLQCKLLCYCKKLPTTWAIQVDTVTCQAHPALVKRVQCAVRYPEPRWFVGDPTSLARDNIYIWWNAMFFNVDKSSISEYLDYVSSWGYTIGPFSVFGSICSWFLLPAYLVYTNIFIQDYTIAKFILIKGAFLLRAHSIYSMVKESSDMKKEPRHNKKTGFSAFFLFFPPTWIFFIFPFGTFFLPDTNKTIFLFLFLFLFSPTCQNHPCRDRLTIEYNECSLIYPINSTRFSFKDLFFSHKKWVMKFPSKLCLPVD